MADGYVFGTAPDCDVRISGDDYVSARHARIWEDADGALWVVDLGSTNGVRIGPPGLKDPIAMAVGTRKAEGPTRLRRGESVYIGRTEVPWRR